MENLSAGMSGAIGAVWAMAALPMAASRRGRRDWDGRRERGIGFLQRAEVIR
jgi:hypothetical protein